MPSFRDYIRQQVVVGDGAMATLLYQYGVPVNSCYENLNRTRPELIKDVHRQYREAGAVFLTSNTFGAHRERLERYGLAEELKAINREGIRLAKEVAQDSAFVFGSIGPIRGGRPVFLHKEELARDFREQAAAILEENPDGLLLETFLEAEELLLALKEIRTLTDIPVIAQLSVQERDRTVDGQTLTDAFLRLLDAGADGVGLNCRVGPYGLLRAFEHVHLPAGVILSAFPNAGLPEWVDGEYVYQSTPEYFAASARQLQEKGVRIIGGCCGTTPAHIAALARAVQGLKPVSPAEEKKASPAEPTRIILQSESAAKGEQPLPARAGNGCAETTLVELVQQRPTVIVELDPPRDLAIDSFMQGAKALQEAGADALTMADNSLATTRMSNMALGRLLLEKLQMRSVVHMACRDRNLIGQQSHLLGLHALGLNHILAVTGDPARFGDTPGASSVFDHTSFDLIRMMKQLNEGLSYSGKPLQEKAHFVVGAAFNPHVRHLEAALRRLEKKIAAGADFIMTQPIYDHRLLEEIHQATRALPVPLFIGIMPLVSSRNAEFLHHEVPGIFLPEEVRRRMAQYEGERARQEGLAIAEELLDTALRYFNGIYFMTPFMRYEMTAALCQTMREKTKRKKEARL